MKFRILGLAIGAALLLAACSEVPEMTETTMATLPTFQTELTPAQQLSAAAEKTRAFRYFDVTFTQTSKTEAGEVSLHAAWQAGIGETGEYTALLQSYTTENGGAPTEESARWYHGGILVEKTRQGVTRQEGEFTAAEIFELLGTIPHNETLLEIFCAQKLTASPSNDGSFRYQTRELSQEAYQQMLYGDVRAWSSHDARYAVELLVDSEGQLRELVFFCQYTKTESEQITLAISPKKAAPQIPKWAGIE
ncbi:MAG: hypothetical protein IJ351_06290 [Oscillospiraceae bacterium]|nr:hypothetical protein [Oscillospiraceae bacterium]